MDAGRRVRRRPRGRPIGVLVVLGALTSALVAGGVGDDVVPSAGAATCRPATMFTMGGSAPGGSQTLDRITEPLLSTVGERLAVVTVPALAPEGDYDAQERQAVSTLTASVAEQVAGCPDGAILLFGYSQGAQVIGDVAARVGTGRERGIPADRVRAVGLFGDPARDPGVRTVPEDGAGGRAALGPRVGGFGALEGATIEICAPGDPVCDQVPGVAPASLQEAFAAPAHASYPHLSVAASTPATRWASDSLARLITSLPAVGADATAPPVTARSVPPTVQPRTVPPRTVAPSGTPGTSRPPFTVRTVPPSSRPESTPVAGAG